MAAIRRRQLGDEVHHVVPGRSDRQPIRPRVLRRLKLAEFWRQVPRREVADLVAIAAAIGFDEIQPLILGLEILGYAVALVAGAGEAAQFRDLDHRGPVYRRIVLRGRGEARRRLGGQVEGFARLGGDFRRVDETVAAHPNLVMRFGQVRHDIPSAFVGDRDLGEPRAELGGLRDDPDPSFRPEPAGDDPADIVIVNGNRRGGALLSACPSRKHRQGQYCGENGFPGAHDVSLRLIDFRGIRRIVDQIRCKDALPCCRLRNSIMCI